MDIRKFADGEFLSVREAKESPSKQLIILSAGAEIADDQGNSRFQCLVEIDGRQRLWRPNKTTIQALGQAWGYDSDKYVGKKVSLGVAIFSGKESIMGTPGQ